MAPLNTPVILALAYLLDQIIGDPLHWPHPVIGMGKIISEAEKRLNQGSAAARRLKGMLLAVGLVLGAFWLVRGILVWLWLHNPWLSQGVAVVLIAASLAGKSLLQAGNSVKNPLAAGDVTEARKKLSHFVSRDTSDLNNHDIARGAIETIAENYVDGIFSPLFYAALGGAPLVMAFKAVSTLDSMIGYSNERYRNFGWFAARLDDWVNYLPARLAVIFLLGAGWICRLPVRRAFTIWRRDAAKHPSPNGGNPESVVAGLLGIQLGGKNRYHGRIEYRAEMGDPEHEITAGDLVQCCKIIRIATWLALIPCLILAWCMTFAWRF